MGAVTVLWLGTAIVAGLDTRHELDELLDAHLAQAASLLVSQQAFQECKPDEHVDDEVANAPHVDPLADPRQLHPYARRVAYQVWHEGELILHSPNAPKVPMSQVKQGFETLRLGHHRWRLFATPGARSDIQIYVAEQMSSRTDILLSMWGGLLGPLLVVLPLMAVAMWVVVNRALRPLRDLSQAVAQRQPGAMDPVALPHGASTELHPLVDSLNHLLGRIGSLLQSERRFTADAAHELRTPIAAIRTQAQVAQGARDEAERSHALRATILGCDRAAHLIQQLLTLSRLEAGAVLSPAPVNLAQVARGVLDDVEDSARLQRQTCELEAAEAGCTVRGDEALLRVLIRNLVDNALRYSPPGAQVRVRVRPWEEGVRLTVEDSGPGLPPDLLVRLGERFFRPAGQTATGSGLGWSIVQRIAQVHSATVQAGLSARLGGLSVQVSWPATQSSTSSLAATTS